MNKDQEIEQLKRRVAELENVCGLGKPWRWEGEAWLSELDTNWHSHDGTYHVAEFRSAGAEKPIRVRTNTDGLRLGRLFKNYQKFRITIEEVR